MQERAVGLRWVVKPLAEAPLLGGKSHCTPSTLRDPPIPLRDPPASLSRRLPVRASPMPDLQRLPLGISRLLQAIPLLPLRLHRKHFVDLIMR